MQSRIRKFSIREEDEPTFWEVLYYFFIHGLAFYGASYALPDLVSIFN